MSALVLALLLAAAAPPADLASASAELEANEAEARWLLWYDRLAWESSDLVLEEPEEVVRSLGPEWFCWSADDGDHAVYGRFVPERDAYEPVLHYVRRDGAWSKTGAAPDAATSQRYGRALATTGRELGPYLRRLGLRHNQYVRPVSDGLEVLVLPAAQPDGTLVAGGLTRVSLDAEGRSIRTRAEAFDPNVLPRGGSGPTVLDRRFQSAPGVGDIFFARSFGRARGPVVVKTECATWSLVEAGGTSAWIAAPEPSRACRRAFRAGRGR